MENWRNLIITEQISILEAIKVIDSGGGQIALVADPAGRLCGTLTDADVRRAILSGMDLSLPALKIMNTCPTTIRDNDPESKALDLMRTHHLRQIPVLDANGCIVNTLMREEFLDNPHLPNAAVIMAGGLGTRLAPLTQNCPKPMLTVGAKPLLEIILDCLIESGFRRFFIAVNYMCEMIVDYFGDGMSKGVSIEYLQEDKRLGTAGALCLLPTAEAHPVLVINGDILTRINFQKIISYHTQMNAAATMAVKQYSFQVPYGVAVSDEQHYITAITEKPVHDFFVNAGIYVLSSSALCKIPDNCYFDMPSLFQKLLSENKPIAAFPIHEYWLDIGQPDDYQKANREFRSIFKVED